MEKCFTMWEINFFFLSLSILAETSNFKTNLDK